MECTIPVAWRFCPASWAQKEQKKEPWNRMISWLLALFDCRCQSTAPSGNLYSRSHFIYPLGEARNFSWGIPLMNSPFTRCSGDNRGSFLQDVFCLIFWTGNDRRIEFANDGLHFGFIHFIDQTVGLSLPVSLFSGFMICHVLPPVIILSLRWDELYILFVSVIVLRKCTSILKIQ